MFRLCTWLCNKNENGLEASEVKVVQLVLVGNRMCSFARMCTGNRPLYYSFLEKKLMQVLSLTCNKKNTNLACLHGESLTFL